MKTVSDNTQFGGVVPAVAIESHTSGLAGLVEDTLQRLPVWDARRHNDEHDGAHSSIVIDHVRRVKPDVIAVTRGPGMMANLAVGLNTAKGLALALQRPLIAVNHMQAHALTPRLISALENSFAGSSDSEEAALKAGRNAPFPPPPVETVPPMKPKYPYLSLLVSGAHTQLSLSLSPTSHPVLASVSHLALGRMLDHSARLILPPELIASHKDVMYARLMESFAFPHSSREENYAWYHPPTKRAEEIKPSHAGDTWRWTLPVPLADTRRMEFDFTGLRGALTKIIHHEGYMGLPFMDKERRAMAREVMRLCFEHLASRIIFTLSGDIDHTLISADTSHKRQTVWGRDIKSLVVSGGVASNKFLRHVLRTTLDARGFPHVEVVAPPSWLCTDNATMIAWTGMKMWDAGYRSDMNVLPLKKWSIDPRAEDGGILGVDGWVMERHPL